MVQSTPCPFAVAAGETAGVVPEDVTGAEVPVSVAEVEAEEELDIAEGKYRCR